VRGWAVCLCVDAQTGCVGERVVGCIFVLRACGGRVDVVDVVDGVDRIEVGGA
jgi:hypothetical protein